MRRVLPLCCLLTVACHSFAQDYLLIPWGGGGDPRGMSWGMYDAFDGRYLGDLIESDPVTFEVPHSAAQGPDGLIYITDQVESYVLRYDLDGNYVDTFLDASDGLDNIRGLAFLGDDLLVCNAPALGLGVIDYSKSGILRFDSEGAVVAEIGRGTATWDLEVTSDGYIIADAEPAAMAPQDMRFYAPDGSIHATPFRTLFAVQTTTAADDTYWNLNFDGFLTRFDADGVISRRLLPVAPSAGRGVYPLGNGQLLVTTFSSGVFVFDPDTGGRTATIRVGYGFGTITPISESCLPDLDGDGSLTIFDFLMFFNLFDDRDLVADFDGDGEFTIFDFLAFQNAFGAGCA